MDEDVNRRLHGGSVPAAHCEEAEAHAHVEPLANSAAPGQSRVLLLTLRKPSCTGDTRTQHGDASRACSQTHGGKVRLGAKGFLPHLEKNTGLHSRSLIHFLHHLRCITFGFWNLILIFRKEKQIKWFRNILHVIHYLQTFKIKQSKNLTSINVIIKQQRALNRCKNLLFRNVMRSLISY